MNILLDTHILLWWLADDPHLTQKSRKLITQKNNIFVSAASIWEISIKKSIGKLVVPDILQTAIKNSDFTELNITLEHAQLAGSLPFHHRDPFDRMLIAQAKLEKCSILTHGQQFNAYKVKLLKNE